jgi:hypothetical protein
MLKGVHGYPMKYGLRLRQGLVFIHSVVERESGTRDFQSLLLGKQNDRNCMNDKHGLMARVVMDF